MGCITLLSDFGLQDASVAITKGLLLQHAPGSNIIDLSHEVIPFNIRQAAYLLEGAYNKFPAGTCHLAIFDLFSEPIPKLVLVACDGHYFLSPDNGLLPMALVNHNGDAWVCFELTKEYGFSDWITAAGNVIRRLQSATPGDITYPPHKLKKIKPAPVEPNGSVISCEVLHIDHYENVVVNITQQQFNELRNGRRFRINIMELEDVTEISKSYSEVKEGTKLCRFNSNDHLEICVNRGKAASLFGFRLGSKHNDIKIIFE